MRRGGGKVVVTAALAAALVGCTAPVAGGLTEDDANRVVVALERAGVPTTKEADPAAEGHYRVLVPREDAARAVASLREEELPPRPTTTVLDALGKSSLVPSGAVEHAQYVAGLAGELERTLAGIDGVVAARVHVSVPPPDPLSDRPATRSTASVLLKHRGATPPIDAASVQRLVAGAVAGMKPDDVAVVMLPRPVLPPAPASQIAYFGPIGVTRGSLGYVRVLVGAGVLALLGTVGALLALWIKHRRFVAEADAEAAKNEGAR